MRTARIGQSQQLGRFVKSFACRIVQGLAEQGVAPHPVNPHELGVAARDQQGNERKLGRIVAEKGGQQVPLQVVHAQSRLAQTGRQRAGQARPDQQRTGQARPPGVGHPVDLAQIERRLLEHLLNQRQGPANMVTTGQLRHDTAIGLMQIDLAVQGLRLEHGKPSATGIDHSDSGFITARLDSQDNHGQRV